MKRLVLFVLFHVASALTSLQAQCPMCKAALTSNRDMNGKSEATVGNGDSDESVSESSWVLLAGFLWAIPILGFIGTVLGLSIAIGEFGSVMSAAGQADALLPALRKVTAGLGVAFDTTLEALVAALIIQLLITFLRKAEQQFLDQCSEYCSRHIVNRLRILPFQESPETVQR